MKFELKQRERLFVAILYFVILTLIYKIIGGDFDVLLGKTSNDNAIWFFSGALMIVLGKYVIETYFTKPSDAVANSIATLIALIGLSNKSIFFGYTFIFSYAILIFLTSIFCIATKDTQREKLKMVSQFAYKFVSLFGTSEVIFSMMYLSATYSYFGRPDHLVSFIIAITFWIILIFFDLGALIVKKIITLFSLFNSKGTEELGIAIGCENPFFYRVEIDLFKNTKASTVKYGDLVAIETSQNVGSIGMVIDKKHLLSKRWLSVYLLRDETATPVKIDLRSKKIISDPKSVFNKTNCAYLIEYDSLELEEQEAISENNLFKNKENFVGYVTAGSNINTINFSVIRETGEESTEISEGSILKTTIYGKETLYQVINANTKEEHLENFDTHGFVIGIARKLGKYDYTQKVLNVSKWVPSIYSPLFFPSYPKMNEAQAKVLAESSIGRLPNTDLQIPITDINSIVTHNTAILGILGVGKSCLAYELIKKVSDQNIKVICIDITNEYKKELINYIPATNAVLSDDENAFNEIRTKYEYIHIEGPTGQYQKEVPDKSGNLAEYKACINKSLCQFLFGTETIPDSKEFETTQKVRIFNVDYHKASKGEKIGIKVLTSDLTQAEKTRIIAEELFKILMKIPLVDDKKAKVWLVFEEAHSLIPEWNSVASEGDKTAVNGTAKIILQGRKYGLGSLVITQRTANVSKSILNQCNTVFALRVFDDTGKDFLANYIGREYADTLATLEERHAVAIGKGLKLKQPVILELNDKRYVIAK